MTRSVIVVRGDDESPLLKRLVMTKESLCELNVKCLILRI